MRLVSTTHHGPAPELRGGDTIAADRNVAREDVRFAAHYGLNSDIAPRPKSAMNRHGPLFDHLVSAGEH